ncbi:hypothetical protein HPB52_018441 [Rhipicephalus sanguineus]|uniref:Uncharacterized protein n=1 Tax=Rhipicephalus sanguineus TaxID=34632 RepID=A0A9D4SRD0_RHISA|nr:hypothetical protein HPB52_018441 [Rhipicephalus sanguineus]
MAKAVDCLCLEQSYNTIPNRIHLWIIDRPDATAAEKAAELAKTYASRHASQESEGGTHDGVSETRRGEYVPKAFETQPPTVPWPTAIPTVASNVHFGSTQYIPPDSGCSHLSIGTTLPRRRSCYERAVAHHRNSSHRLDPKHDYLGKVLQKRAEMKCRACDLLCSALSLAGVPLRTTRRVTQRSPTRPKSAAAPSPS